MAGGSENEGKELAFKQFLLYFQGYSYVCYNPSYIFACTRLDKMRHVMQ